MLFLMTMGTPPAKDALDILLAALAAGDGSALAAIYEQTRTPVYAFALSILKNQQDAEDVLQDTYLRVHAAAGTYQSVGKPLAWILTVTKNLCYQRLREHSRGPEVLPEALEGLPEAVTADDRVLLQSCLDRLTDGERQVVTLHAVAGFKHREIAGLLNMTLPAVLSRYNRAFHKLRRLYEGGES